MNSGKRMLLTGATRGIGRELARQLSAQGVELVLGVRDLRAGEELARSLPTPARPIELDLSDLGSVARCARAIDGDFDAVINNASIMGESYGTTADGIETHFAVNCVGPFLLTRLLLDRVRERIVNVGSQVHRHAGNVEPEALVTPRPKQYDPSRAYAASKLATLWWTFELDRRLRLQRRVQIAVAAHPGLVRTHILEGRDGTRRLRLTRRVQRRFGQSPSSGAGPLHFAATAPLPGGAYVGPSGWYELSGEPAIVEASARAQDVRLGRRSWDTCERLTRRWYEQ